MTYATLRTICGENTLQDLLEKRQEISDKIEEFVFAKVDKWGMFLSYYYLSCVGIFVEQIFIKDMTMSK